MALRDLIQSRLTPQDFQDIKQHLQAIEQIIEGKTVTLTPDEFQRYGSINEQMKLVVNKVKDLKNQNPKFAAPEVDWDEYDVDHNARHELEHIMSRMDGIRGAIRGTKTMHDKDNRDDASAMYEYLAYLSKRNVVGAKEAYDELRQFFKNASQKKTPPPTGDGGDGGM